MLIMSDKILFSIIGVSVVFFFGCSLDKDCQSYKFDKLMVDVVRVDGVNPLCEEDIVGVLKKSGIMNRGDLPDGDIHAIEENMLSTHGVKKVKCYKSTKGKIHITIVPRLPYIEIIKGSDAYSIDNEGVKIPITERNIGLPLFKVYRGDDIRDKEIVGRVSYIKDNSVLDTVIRSMRIVNKGDVRCYCKNNVEVLCGRWEDMEENMLKLESFISTQMYAFMDRYKSLDLRYANEIVLERWL